MHDSCTNEFINFIATTLTLNLDFSDPAQKGNATTFCNLGLELGGLVSFFLTGQISYYLSWRYSFYLFSITAFVWFIPFYYLVGDIPTAIDLSIRFLAKLCNWFRLSQNRSLRCALGLLATRPGSAPVRIREAALRAGKKGRVSTGGRGNVRRSGDRSAEVQLQNHFQFRSGLGEFGGQIYIWARILCELFHSNLVEIDCCMLDARNSADRQKRNAHYRC